jgi:cell division protein FtsQ
MSKKLNFIKIFSGTIIFLVLVGFSYNRHKQKTVNSIKINYDQKEHIFVDTSIVNKLLIQNQKHVKNMPTEDLDLNLIETQLETHPLIENAEVYLDLDNSLYVEISQPKPIGRVVGKEQFYIDMNGNEMPLSSNYSAKVPIVYNLNKKEISNAHQLLKHVYEDDFLSQRVTQIKAYPDEQFSFKLRNKKFEIFVGKTVELEQKFFNFKAFYIKAERDSLFNKYKRIKLQYGSQVVCEKY